MHQVIAAGMASMHARPVLVVSRNGYPTGRWAVHPRCFVPLSEVQRVVAIAVIIACVIWSCWYSRQPEPPKPVFTATLFDWEQIHHIRFNVESFAALGIDPTKKITETEFLHLTRLVPKRRLQRKTI